MKTPECPNCKYDAPILEIMRSGLSYYSCPVCTHNWCEEDVKAAKQSISLHHLHAGKKSKAHKITFSKAS
jgi:transposase-like protein